MPVSSVIIGVDLVPITPIRNVITFQSDITTKECSQIIESNLSGWTADVVLHDGAPNVGKNWLHDAYSQNVLVVKALKIACTHLSKGGWFITKIFRSADYNSLLWVFGKLFGKVHATKPQASRQESAEIFVVCQNYKKPGQIDPKFFDPSSLFADISNFDEALKRQKADLLKPPSKVRKARAQGYEDGDIRKIVTDIQFVTSNTHVDYLATCHEIRLTNEDILKHDSTDQEIKECCADLKVLGRKELLKLLKWRRTLRKDLTAKLLKAIKEKNYQSDTDGADAEDDYLDQLTLRSDEDDIETVPDLQLDDIEAQQDLEQKKELKRLKRKEEKKMKDYQQRVNYGMVNEGDVLIEEEYDLFNLNKITGKKELDAIDDVEPDEVVENREDPSDNLIHSVKKARKVSFSREANVQYFELDKDYESDEERHPSDDIQLEKPDEPKISAPKTILKDKSANAALKRLGSKNSAGGGLLTDLMDVNQSKVAAASKFFDRDSFNDIDLEKEFETDLVDKIANNRPKTNRNEKEERKQSSDIDLSRFDDGIGSDSDSDKDEAIGPGSDDEELSKKNSKKPIKLDPEGLALASMMISSDKIRQDIEDEGWNRYAHADTHLAPKWFREEEEKYCRRNIPVRSELVKEFKQKLRDIDAKPIKKVLQAKARKKRRAMRKMEKVRKKVEAITSNDDITQKERINQIKTVYKNATKTKKKEVKLVVSRKGLPTKKPTKGKYKTVDSRMKKDLRAKQRRESKGKKGTGRGNGANRHGGGPGGARKKRTSNNSMESRSRGPPNRMKSTKGSKSRRK